MRLRADEKILDAGCEKGRVLAYRVGQYGEGMQAQWRRGRRQLLREAGHPLNRALQLRGRPASLPRPRSAAVSGFPLGGSRQDDVSWPNLDATDASRNTIKLLFGELLYPYGLRACILFDLHGSVLSVVCSLPCHI